MFFSIKASKLNLYQILYIDRHLYIDIYPYTDRYRYINKYIEIYINLCFTIKYLIQGTHMTLLSQSIVRFLNRERTAYVFFLSDCLIATPYSICKEE